MKKYRVDQFKCNQHFKDEFDNRLDALDFAVKAARSTFAGPVFLLSQPVNNAYTEIEEVQA